MKIWWPFNRKKKTVRERILEELRSGEWFALSRLAQKLNGHWVEELSQMTDEGLIEETHVDLYGGGKGITSLFRLNQ